MLKWNYVKIRFTLNTETLIRVNIPESFYYLQKEKNIHVDKKHLWKEVE